MRTRMGLRHFGVVLGTVALAACGGGGGGGSKSVSLESKADIIREIGNVETLYGSPDAPAAASSSSMSSRTSGARRLASRFQARQRTYAKAYSPQASETFPCGVSGTTGYEDFTGVARTLPLFAVSPTLDYVVWTDHDCTEGDSTYTVVSDGRFEEGNNNSYLGEVPYYEYQVYGSSHGALSYSYQNADYSDRTKLLGRSETRVNGSLYESRDDINFDYRFSSGGEQVDISINAGESGNPFTVVEDSSVGTLTLDGPISYSTEFCGGGRVEFTTLEALTFGSDEAGSFVNGGQVLIESGSHGVTVTFLDDGSANYVFDDGTSGSLTREEVNVGDSCGMFTG